MRLHVRDSAVEPFGRMKQKPTGGEAETGLHRCVRIGKMLGSGNWAPLAYAVWLRWHRLEFHYANYVAEGDGNGHSHAGGHALREVLKSLAINANSVVVDYGVGMGIAALTLSRHFSSVIGVDLSPELIAIAERNLTRMGVKNVELYCDDARRFDRGLDRVTHVYMFNPFPETVMAVVMKNLQRSLSRVPRRLTVIYQLPACHDCLLQAGFSCTREFRFNHSHPFMIYETQGAMEGGVRRI